MVGIVLYIIEGALFYCSSRLVIAANSSAGIPPWFGAPPRNPEKSTLLRMVAIAFLVGGSIVAGQPGRYWWIVVLVLAMVPAIVATYRHNGTVARRDHTKAGAPPA